MIKKLSSLFGLNKQGQKQHRGKKHKHSQHSESHDDFATIIGEYFQEINNDHTRNSIQQYAPTPQDRTTRECGSYSDIRGLRESSTGLVGGYGIGSSTAEQYNSSTNHQGGDKTQSQSTSLSRQSRGISRQSRGISQTRQSIGNIYTTTLKFRDPELESLGSIERELSELQKNQVINTYLSVQGSKPIPFNPKTSKIQTLDSVSSTQTQDTSQALSSQTAKVKLRIKR